MAKKKAGRKTSGGGINALAPAHFRTTGGKRSGGGRKKPSSGGGKAGFAKGILSGFNFGNAKRVAALVAGAVAAQAVQNQFGAAIQSKTGMNIPVAPAAGLAALAASGTQLVKKTGHAELVQLAAIGSMVPAGLNWATGAGLVPTPKSAGYDDSEGMDDDVDGLVHIGNVGDLDDSGKIEEVRALRLAKKIARAKAKGKDKRVQKLEGRAQKKGLDDNIEEIFGNKAKVVVADPVRVRRGYRDSDGDGIRDRFDVPGARVVVNRRGRRVIVGPDGRVLGRA